METNRQKSERVYVCEDLAVVWRTNVRAILEMLGVSQADLAKELGVSRQSVSAMLNHKNYGLTKIQYLATMYLLRINLDALVGSVNECMDENYRRRIFSAKYCYCNILLCEMKKGL